MLTPESPTLGSHLPPHFLARCHRPHAASGTEAGVIKAPDPTCPSAYLPTQPSLPTHPPTGGHLEEGEILGRQQDPMGTSYQLQLPEA